MDDFNFEEFMTVNAEGEGDESATIAIVSSEQTSPARPTNSRNFRPRNPRSCDFCRGRKTACILERDPPCATCRSMGKACIFSERPPKRKRRNVTSLKVPDRALDNTATEERRKSISLQSESSPEGPPLSWLTQATRVSALPAELSSENQLRMPEDVAATQPERQQTLIRNSFTHLTGNRDNSLDLEPTSTAFLLGDTGESDPYLLRHASLAAHDHTAATKIRYRQVYREGHASNDYDFSLDNERPLVFMLGEHSLHDKYEPRVEDIELQSATQELESICNDGVGVRLIKLYFKFVYPYFPVLSRSQMLLREPDMQQLVRTLPLSLKAAVYATGLPFMIFDDVLSTTLDLSPPSPHKLYRIAWLAIAHEIHTPHLSTLQACLLFLQRVNDDRYVMDSPFRWSFLAWTVSAAQSLGLSTDCSTWSGIPPWERRLRRRLWWATFAMDKWSFMSSGLASHIHADDFDVLPLTAIDINTERCRPEQETVQDDVPQLSEDSHFCHLVELSIILSDIRDSYFTIRASKLTASNFALTLERAKPLRSRLQTWKEGFDIFLSLPQNNTAESARLDGNASLGLLYPVATMIFFRALLRPLDRHLGTPEDLLMRENGREAVRVGAKACCVEVVTYLEGVKRGVWDAFWHSWSRAGFAIASSFIIRLLITSTSTTETDELNSLITRWRWAMRTGGGNSGNVLMSLGLLRLDRSLLKSGLSKTGEDV